MSEQISALIDDELSEFERARLLRDISRDEELARRWSRYQVIGLAMRREPIAASPELSGRVARALAQSPAHSAEPSARQREPAGWYSAGRVAMAASLVGVLLLGGLAIDWRPAPAPGVDAAPAAPQLALQLARLDDGLRWRGVNADQGAALNALLVEHGEFASVSGMNGLSAYTKFVAYDGRR